MDHDINKELSDAQCESLWETARQAAKNIVGDAGLDANVIPRTLDAESLVNEVQEKERTFSNPGGEAASEKKKLLIKAVRTVTDIFTNLCSVVSSAASMAYPPVSLIFASVQHLVKAGDGVKDSFDSMLTIFTEFQSFLHRLSVYKLRKLHAELQVIVIKILVCFIRASGSTATMMRKGKVLSFFKAILMGSDSRARDMLGELEGLASEEGRMFQALTYDVSEEAYRLGRRTSNSQPNSPKSFVT